MQVQLAPPALALLAADIALGVREVPGLVQRVPVGSPVVADLHSTARLSLVCTVIRGAAPHNKALCDTQGQSAQERRDAHSIQ